MIEKIFNFVLNYILCEQNIFCLEADMFNYEPSFFKKLGMPKDAWVEGVDVKKVEEEFVEYPDRPIPDTMEEYNAGMYEMQTNVFVLGKRGQPYVLYKKFCVNWMSRLGSYYENDRAYFFNIHILAYVVALFFMFIVYICYLLWLEKFYFSYWKRRRARFIKLMQFAAMENKGIPEYTLYANHCIHFLQCTKKLTILEFRDFENLRPVVDALIKLQQCSIQHYYTGTTAEVASFLKHTSEISPFIRKLYNERYKYKEELGYRGFKLHVTDEEIQAVA